MSFYLNGCGMDMGIEFNFKGPEDGNLPSQFEAKGKYADLSAAD